MSAGFASLTKGTNPLYSGRVLLSLSELLESRGLLLLDGAMGTELARRGFELRDPLWSARVLIERPEAILDLHLDYLAAGADVLTTASYQISEIGFQASGETRARARAALADAVRLGQTAIERHERDREPSGIALAVSLGPYGAVLADGSEYTGDYELGHAELVHFHRERLAVIADTGAKLVAFETFPTMLEAEAALEALSHFPELRAWLSFVPRQEPRSFSALHSNQLLALGFNCGPVESIMQEAARGRRESPRPVFVYPNRGGRWDPVAKQWLNDEEPQPATWVDQCSSLGIRAVGGCCEIGPDAIRQMRAAIDLSPLPLPLPPLR